MAVLRPLRVVIENYPEDRGRGVRDRQQSRGSGGRHAQGAVLARALHRARRLHGGPAEEVLPAGAGTRGAAARRLLHHLHARSVKDAAGEIVELRCTYDPATRGGDAADGRKVKATLHWVSAAHAVDAEVRLYDRLFKSETPGRRRRLPRRSEPRLARGRRRVQARAVRGRGAAGHALPVRAPGLLLRRSRLAAGLARLQPHRHPEGQLGQGSGRRSESLNARLGRCAS